MRKVITLVASVLLLGALGTAIDEKKAHESKKNVPGTNQTEQVRATELAFAAAAHAKDLQKALSFFDEDIHFFQQGQMLSGIEAERKNWTGMLTNPGLTITWHPELVEASGGLGYTTGPFEIR